LQGFEGILQVDGYAEYNCVLDLRDNAPIQLAYSWAHDFAILNIYLHLH
jgi:transposase